jgi:hypothetical protein
VVAFSPVDLRRDLRHAYDTQAGDKLQCNEHGGGDGCSVLQPLLS